MSANGSDRRRRRAGTQILQRERRSVFWVWIVLAGVGVAAALLAGPLAGALHLSTEAIAVAVPVIELLLLAGALGWLLRVVLRGRRRARD